MKRIILLVLTLLLALLPVCALADVVSYTADFYVADYAEVLSDEVEGLIVLNNDQLNKACGAQIVVVTVNSLGGAEIENYAYTLFNDWKIGDKARNNGLLILLAVQDGTYWLMPGKGLQDYLTAGDLDELANEHFIPQAQVGNFEEGIRQLFSACFEKVSIAYDADVSLNDSLYYTWLQKGSSSTGGARFLSEPLREMPEIAEPVQSIESTAEPMNPPAQQRRDGGGFGFIHVIIILVVLIILFGGVSTIRNRPGRRSAPPPRRPAAPPPPRPPMGGYPRTAPRPAPRPVPRPPMGGGMSGRPTGGYNRPSAPSRPTGGFGGGRTGSGGGSGGSFSRPASRPASRPVSRPSSSRPSGGFGGGRSGGGGMTRGGGSGGSFRGGR